MSKQTLTPPLEDALTTESRNPSSAELDACDARAFVALMNREDAEAIEAVGRESEAIARAIDRTAETFRRGGRLVYVGAGTSGRLGVLDAAECPPTFGTPPEMVVGLIAGGFAALTRAVEGAEDDRDQGAIDLESLRLERRDLVLGIATSGRTPYVLGAIDCAKRVGSFTIGLACNRPSLLGNSVDLEIAPIVGPEVLAGSTRLKAGTATKLVLNMITTGAFVLIGKTFGDRMIDVKPTNEKLRLRTRRFLRELAHVDDARAEELLRLCDGELKTALVVAGSGTTADHARKVLATNAGQVRAALKAILETDSK